MIRIVLHGVIQAFLVHGNVAGLHQGRAIGPQHGALRTVGAGEHFHRDRVEHRRRHLAGDGAFPDQRIQRELIGLELVLDVRRQHAGRGRANRLVRLLSVFRLGLVDSRLFGQSLLAVQLHDDIADLADGLLREIERVGAHVGDQTDLAFADVDTFVQAAARPAWFSAR